MKLYYFGDALKYAREKKSNRQPPETMNPEEKDPCRNCPKDPEPQNYTKVLETQKKATHAKASRQMLPANNRFPEPRFPEEQGDEPLQGSRNPVPGTQNTATERESAPNNSRSQHRATERRVPRITPEAKCAETV